MPDTSKLSRNRLNSGFTFVEVLVVMAFMTILFTLISINLTGLIPKASLTSSSETIVADLRQQQVQAMLGDTQGGASSSEHGMYFNATNYIVFIGSTYNPADPLNIVINLENTAIENVNFPNSTIIFNKGSGEVQGLISGTYSFTLRNTVSGQQEVISINRYGGITIN